LRSSVIGGPALLLIPASPITHARSWKGVVPALARRFTVVTTDGLGTGRSDRPHTPECYAPPEVAADLLAVLDAAGVDRAVLVAHCHAVTLGAAPGRGSSRACRRCCRDRPEHRGRATPIPMRWRRSGGGQTRWGALAGWSMRNRHFWRQDGGYREWIEFFFGQLLPEPHSTKQ